MVEGPPRCVYLDASALVKLIVAEPESDALRTFLSSDLSLISSRIAAVEVRRVAVRQRERNTDKQVQSVLEGVLFVELDQTIAAAAGVVPPPPLGALDAIHLASAESVENEIAAVITYDIRLADAARAAGLTVISPG